jgi:carboxypeptidase Taq
MQQDLAKLKSRLATICDLNGTLQLLGWDQHTYMPENGLNARIRQMTTLEQLSHDLMSSPDIGELLEKLEPKVADLDSESPDARLLRVVRRDYDDAVKLPDDLVKAKAELTGLAMDSWMKNKPGGNFADYCPFLEKIFDICRAETQALGYDNQPYDALLNRYETGMLTSQLKSIFDNLKADLVPFFHQLKEKSDYVDDSVLYQNYDVNRQWEFGMGILHDMGFNFNAGRQDKSPHPFTTNFGIGDVRTTTRIFKNDFKSGFFSTVHEGGHALYEQNINMDFDRSPLAEGTSLGIHESQSRLWENLIGRSRGFLNNYHRHFSRLFPSQAAQLPPDKFYRAVNRVKPSMIRVEADEVTYSIHIFLRFELELKLLSGDLAMADLPDAWNELMKSYLGICPKSPSEGCMQDMHWADASVGYFPTYALGNLYGVQILNQARNENPALDDQVSHGELLPLKNWLTEKIYRYGRLYDPGELLLKVTGKPLSAAPFTAYIKDKYTEIYDL